MSIESFISVVESAGFETIDDPARYVSARRQLIEQGISAIARAEGCSLASLRALQDEIEKARLLNPSPIERLKCMLALLEE